MHIATSPGLHAALRVRASTVETRDTRLWHVVGPLLELHVPAPPAPYHLCDKHAGEPYDPPRYCAVCRTEMPCKDLRIIAAGLGVNPDAYT